MYCTKPVTRTANKVHRCTYCGDSISVGEKYKTWKSIDNAWFTNKMHHECYDYQAESGDNEYFAYQNERPSKEPS